MVQNAASKNLSHHANSGRIEDVRKYEALTGAMVRYLCLLSGVRVSNLVYRQYLDTFLTQSGPFTDPEWVAGDGTIQSLESSKVL